MNLRKMIFWKTPDVQALAGAAEPTRPEATGTAPTEALRSDGNVIPWPTMAESDAPASQAQIDEDQPAAPIPVRAKGLMNAPELSAFFDDNHLGLGRHNGSHYRTQEALDLGCQSLISKFQNTVTELAERRQAKMNKLQSELIAIEGVSPSMSAQLRLACEQLQRDIAQLRDQIDSAGDGKGWVLEPLNRYRIGFTKGLREAIDFELLAG